MNTMNTIVLTYESNRDYPRRFPVAVAPSKEKAQELIARFMEWSSFFVNYRLSITNEFRNNPANANKLLKFWIDSNPPPFNTRQYVKNDDSPFLSIWECPAINPA